MSADIEKKGQLLTKLLISQNNPGKFYFKSDFIVKLQGNLIFGIKLLTMFLKNFESIIEKPTESHKIESSITLLIVPGLIFDIG